MNLGAILQLSKIELIAYAVASAFVTRIIWTTHLPVWAHTKPFVCCVCMSGWYALVLGLVSGKGIETLPIACVAMVTAFVFENTTNKYL